jgi:hypothetical protein
MIRQLAFMLVKHGYDVTVHSTSRAEIWGDEKWLILQNGGRKDGYDLAIVPELWTAAQSLSRVRRTVWIPMFEYLLPRDVGLYRGYTDVVAPTRMAKEWLERHGLRSQYIGWEVPPPAILGASYDPPCRFLHFTRADNWRKSGTDLLLQAWQQYADEIDGTLTIKCRGELQKLRIPEVDNLIVDIKAYPTLDTLYAEHDAVVQPSRREGIGLHALEARARGLPTLVTSGTTLAEFAPREDWLLPAATGKRFKALYEREVDIDALGEMLIKVAKHKRHYVKDAMHVASFAGDRYAEWEQAWQLFVSGPS